MDLRSLQRPLKEKYRSEPGSSRITLEARASRKDAPISCSVDIGRAVYEAEAHAGVGGTGTAACSGDLLLGALAACAQVTCQMVAEAMRIETERIEVTVTGEMDLAGTLGISEDVPVGFESILTSFEVVAPGATGEQLEKLRRRTEQYCVVFQTLANPPELRTQWA
ncbi:MAG: OsmC family protein [Actinomycetota bacterium]|nr:OsmC family protein [Actinomycetota bacterium]